MSEAAFSTPQDALAALMFAVSAANEDIRTAELLKISNAINNLPVFAGYDPAQLPNISKTVFDFFENDDGLEVMFAAIREVLPSRLYETAYALACDVAAADGEIAGEEERMLEEIRYELSIDRLCAAAIERGSRARHTT